jgi:hypothetical protein
MLPLFLDDDAIVDAMLCMPPFTYYRYRRHAIIMMFFLCHAALYERWRRTYRLHDMLPLLLDTLLSLTADIDAAAR